ncbi:uncharacterized protein [Dysidea avara]|uniref:uncharacterized protein isoform X2 n=1 Tax=Dysidea avara TaxID=196820 RepID=UPI003329D495
MDGLLLVFGEAEAQAVWDWFRINPLEMVLLGCQSLYSEQEVRRDHGTMILVMEDLSQYMHNRPRFWLNLCTVLRCTFVGDTPSSMLQRCNLALCGLWKSLHKFSQYGPMIRGWYCEYLLSTVNEHHSGQLSSEIKALQQSLVELNNKVMNCWQLLGATDAPIKDDDRFSINISQAVLYTAHQLMAMKKDGCSSSVMTKVHLMLEHAEAYPNFLVDRESFTLHCQRVLATTGENGITLTLDILQLLAVCTMKKSDTETPTVEQQAASDEEQSQTTITEQIISIFETINKALVIWEGHGYNVREVFIKILELALVMLSRDEPATTIPELNKFFDKSLSVLMTYATEGYLSTNPGGIMCELLEFICSVIENGNSANNAVLSILPNLFGPVFGVKNHTVSCKLLEYGYLAVCSQHRNSLLTEGLRFLMDIYHMFIPIDNIRAQQLDCKRRITEWKTAEEMVELILNKVTQTEPPSPDKNNSLAIVDTAALREQRGNVITYDDLAPVTDTVRKEDKKIRLTILQKLLELACAMIRNGDNVAYLYASSLPKLFYYTPPLDIPKDFTKEKLIKCLGKELPQSQSITARWKLDKKEFAVQLLNLAILAQDKDASSPFHICGIVVPKLVKNLEKMEFSDDEVMSLTLEIMQITYGTLEAGHSIDELLSHGIDLMSYILPSRSSVTELKQLISQMASHFVTASNSSMLFLTKSACEFMCKNFPSEIVEIRQLFRAILFKGKRNEIRMLFRVCHKPLLDCSFTDLHQYFYQFSDGQMTAKQLTTLCELLLTMMDVESPDKSKRTITHEGLVYEGESTEVTANKEDEQKKVKEVVGKLLTPCVLTLRTSLQEKKFKKEIWESLSKQVSQIALFCTLFYDDMTSLVDYSVEDLHKTFESKFPPDVLGNEDTMNLLALCAKRIEHMQLPRYESLKVLLRNTLKHFLTVDLGPGTSEDSALSSRYKLFDNHIISVPRNTEDMDLLKQAGYSPLLWSKKLSISVQTDGRCSLEENMRQTLLACFREYVNILTQMAFTHVSVDGENVKVTDMFDELLSLTELKGRRAIAVKLIDQKLGKAHEGHFYDKKLTLLAKEDEIEADFEKQARVPVKPKKFTVALNTNFFDSARCCGSQIIGCYAPTGEHCERPLEIGLRCDSAVASIYNESNTEIENCEIMFTHEGAYIYKAYTNGHPYDTSQVWIAFFSELLKEPLVPSVIIPRYYPNNQTWELLRRSIQTELTGSMLTCRPDFSPEWRTYYDHRPERIKCGEDIVLHPGFAISEDGQTKPTLQRQRSILSKDLAGMIFEEVFETMRNDKWLAQFRFLGKFISQYISTYIHEGVKRVDIVFDGFDYERWKKSYLKSHNEEPMDKQNVIDYLVHCLDDNMYGWCIQVDLNNLWQDHPKQFLEMKIFLEKIHYELDDSFKFKGSLFQEVKKILIKHTAVVPISHLPDALQEQLMHWIFRNEDRVWRYRGGRDGRETLQQFMGFIGRTTGGNSPNTDNSFAGVVIFRLPSEVSSWKEMNPKFDDLVGYAVGEMCTPNSDSDDDEEENRWHPTTWNTYEVVTAWVHPSFRGLNLAVKMYFDISLQAPSSFVMCDMLNGSVERIIQSSRLLLFLQRIGVLNWVIQRRQKSYFVHTQGGDSEQFEQVVFRVLPIRTALYSQQAIQNIKRVIPRPGLMSVILTAVQLAIIYGIWNSKR